MNIPANMVGIVENLMELSKLGVDWDVVVAGQIVSEFSENLKKDILDKQEQRHPYQETEQVYSELPISGAKKEEINESTVKKETKNELNLLALLIAIIKNWFSRTK